MDRLDTTHAANVGNAKENNALILSDLTRVLTGYRLVVDSPILDGTIQHCFIRNSDEKEKVGAYIGIQKTINDSTYLYCEYGMNIDHNHIATYEALDGCTYSSSKINQLPLSDIEAINRIKADVKSKVKAEKARLKRIEAMWENMRYASDSANCSSINFYSGGCISGSNPATGLRPATIANLKLLLSHRLRIILKDNGVILFLSGIVFVFYEQLPDLTDKTTPLYFAFRSLCAEYLLPYDILDFLRLSDIAAGTENHIINFDDYLVNYIPDIIEYGGSLDKHSHVIVDCEAVING